MELSTNDDLVFYAIYLWICITKIELKYQAERKSDPDAECKHHMFTTYDLDRLVSCLLKHLCRQRENEPDNEWNPFKESAMCLMLLATLLEQEIIPPLIPFVNHNITSSEWQLRDAALIAFGSLLIDFENAEPLIKNLFHFDDKVNMVKELLSSDSNETVKLTSLCLANRICERFPDKKSELESLVSEANTQSFKYLLFKNEFLSDFKPLYNESFSSPKKALTSKVELASLTNGDESGSVGSEPIVISESLENQSQPEEDSKPKEEAANVKVIKKPNLGVSTLIK
jgi:hypothetical protein